MAVLICLTTAVEAATVNLAWDAAAPGTDVTNYIVRFGSQSGNHPSQVTCGLVTQCAVTVPNNSTQYFVVVAVSSAGAQSQPSGEVVARVGTTGFTLALNQSSLTFPAEGGVAVLNVAATTTWNATSTSTFVRVMPGSGATGSGAFSYAVTPNAGPTARTGVMSIGGINVSVVQPAGPPRTWALPMNLTAADYDGDGKTDIGVYRDSTGEWYSVNSSTGTMRASGWGAPSMDDIPAAADYDGDGRADVAVYRRSTGEWFLNRSTAGGATAVWGAPSFGDLPIPSDFDGDGRADVGVYRGTTGDWILSLSAGGNWNVRWGAPSLQDAPVPADYDGDGRSDIGVYRHATGEWFILNSSGGSTTAVWGAPSLGDIPVPGDYDGDGRADIAVYRSTSGHWFIVRSSGGSQTIPFGAPSLGDIPVQSDYDGDGRTDAGIYRSSSGEWIISRSGGGTQYMVWGAPPSSDIVRGR